MKRLVLELSKFAREIDRMVNNYLKGEKEIWEYDEVAERLSFVVRVLTLIMPLLFYIMAGAIFYLGFKGVKLEGLGVLVAAVIAGGFAMLSSIGNTEANIRSLRSAWIEGSRRDLAKYITNCRRYLTAAEKCRRARLEKIRKKEAIESGEYNNGIGSLDDVKHEVHLKENEAIEAQMNFFESYAAINVKYRGMSKGAEVYFFNDLKEHYSKYREVCCVLYTNKSVYKKVDKVECYELDAKLGDRFGSYFVEEWKRAKKGDKELIAKKNIVISILVFFVLAYSHNVMINSFSFEDESPGKEEKVSTET